MRATNIYILLSLFTAEEEMIDQISLRHYILFCLLLERDKQRAGENQSEFAIPVPPFESS